MVNGFSVSLLVSKDAIRAFWTSLASLLCFCSFLLLFFNILCAGLPGSGRGISCLYIIQHLLIFCRSKDLLMRVVALNMSPELTLVEKVAPLFLCLLLLMQLLLVITCIVLFTKTNR